MTNVRGELSSTDRWNANRAYPQDNGRLGRSDSGLSHQEFSDVPSGHAIKSSQRR